MEHWDQYWYAPLSQRVWKQEASWSSLQWQNEEREREGVVFEEARVTDFSFLPKYPDANDIENIPPENATWWGEATLPLGRRMLQHERE